MIDDPEIAALNTAYTALKGLDPDAIARNLNWLATRLGVSPASKAAPPGNVPGVRPQDAGTSGSDAGEEPHCAGFADFPSSAEFLSKIQDPSDEERVLAVAAYLQEKQPDNELTGFSINKELKHIGHRMQNITRAIDSWVEQRPQLMIQLRKSGTTRQAKKVYKVTQEGLMKVRSRMVAPPRQA